MALGAGTDNRAEFAARRLPAREAAPERCARRSSCDPPHPRFSFARYRSGHDSASTSRRDSACRQAWCAALTEAALSAPPRATALPAPLAPRRAGVARKARTPSASLIASEGRKSCGLPRILSSCPPKTPQTGRSCAFYRAPKTQSPPGFNSFLRWCQFQKLLAKPICTDLDRCTTPSLGLSAWSCIMHHASLLRV